MNLRQLDQKGQPKLGGTVESDETYVGGKTALQATPEETALGLDGKMPVVSLVERGGKIRSFVTADVTAVNVGRILAGNVNRDSHLMTHSPRLYKHIGQPFAGHGTTNHSKGGIHQPDGTHSNRSNQHFGFSSAEFTELSATLSANTFIDTSRNLISSERTESG